MPFEDKFQHVPLPVLLKNYNIRLKHKWGQNFLSDRNLLQKITAAAAVQEGDLILEVGCGAGTLTACLARAGARVEGVEIDERLEPLLSDRFTGDAPVHITYADALTVDLQQLVSRPAGSTVKIVSNVPYYITTDLVERFFLTMDPVECIVLLVQQEAAEHFTATGGKVYGPLTILAQTYGRVEQVFQIPPGAFTPPPAVRSTLLRLTAVKDRDPVGWRHYPEFYRFLKTCFRQRRKTLDNNLKKTDYIFDERGEVLLMGTKQKFNLAADCRPEQCPSGFFADLYLNLADLAD